MYDTHGFDCATEIDALLLCDCGAVTEPSWAPLDVTVYTAHGEVTVLDVRDDSIVRRENGELWMEAADGSHNCRTFTFFDVQGWSSVPHKD